MPNECYSGKRKTHTLKNLLLADASGYVCYLSPTYEGRVHDKRLADESGYILPPDSTLAQDLGFYGFTLPHVTALQPLKKPKGIALSAAQKAANRTLAALRCRIEHVIASVKRYRILKERLRL